MQTGPPWPSVARGGARQPFRAQRPVSLVVAAEAAAATPPLWAAVSGGSALIWSSGAANGAGTDGALSMNTVVLPITAPPAVLRYCTLPR